MRPVSLRFHDRYETRKAKRERERQEKLDRRAKVSNTALAALGILLIVIAFLGWALRWVVGDWVWARN